MHHAEKDVPYCVDLEGVKDFGHMVSQVEHVVAVHTDSPEYYTKREVQLCVEWLRIYAPASEYARVRV